LLRVLHSIKNNHEISKVAYSRRKFVHLSLDTHSFHEHVLIALSMNDARSRLVVFVLRDPHVFESTQRG